MVETIILKTDSPITDFANERNLLLEKARSDWVLFLDSDEKISSELQKELDTNNFKCDGYFIKRLDYFMGKWLKFGETGNIKLLRLGKKGAGKWVRKVHEYWAIKNTGTLFGTILHFPLLTIRKINYYSSLDAGEFGKFTYWQLVKPIAKFIQNYFLRLGFLDGLPGFVHAYMMSLQSLVVRVKQYEKTFVVGNRH